MSVGRVDVCSSIAASSCKVLLASALFGLILPFPVGKVSEEIGSR